MKDLDDQRWKTCVHESAHVVVAEARGLQTEDVTNRPIGRSSASVKFDPDVGTIEDRIVALVGPSQLFHDLGWDDDGCGADMHSAHVLAESVARANGCEKWDVLAWARDQAHEIVMGREGHYIIERLAEKLYEKPMTLRTLEVGEVIRNARATYREAHRDWLAPPKPKGSLDGLGPAEELAQRAALVASMPKAPPKPKGVKRTARAKSGSVVVIDHRTEAGRKEAEKMRLKRGGLPRNALAGLLKNKKRLGTRDTIR